MTREFDQSYVKVVTDLLTKGRYSMTFQPIVDTGTGGTFGFEALLRGPKGTPPGNPTNTLTEKTMRRTLLFLILIWLVCGPLSAQALNKRDNGCSGTQNGRYYV